MNVGREIIRSVDRQARIRRMAAMKKPHCRRQTIRQPKEYSGSMAETGSTTSIGEPVQNDGPKKPGKHDRVQAESQEDAGMKKKDRDQIEVILEVSDGYEKRYTKACLDALRRRQAGKRGKEKTA